MKPINFDANASCRPISKVREYLAQFQADFLNPSSVHSFGQAAKAVIDEASYEISSLVGAKKTDKIIFTSGASEANNAALYPNFLTLQKNSIQLACSNVEHASVLETLRKYSELGYAFKELTLNEIETIERQIELFQDLKIFALMAANNESGQIFDIKKIFSTIKKLSPRTRLHCDAVQAVGKIPVNFSEWQVDSMSISGHKIGAISGIGALIIAEHLQIVPWIFGGPQQYSLRAGTENVLGIKTLAIAAREAKKRLDNGLDNLIQAKTQLLNMFSEFGESIEINKVSGDQLPNTISLRVPGVKADDLVVALDLCSLAISAGSACASGKPNPSHVLLAQGLSEVQAKETIRISLEPEISNDELVLGLNIIRQTITRMTQSRRAA